MSSSGTRPHNVVIDGFTITPGILKHLKDLQECGPTEVKNCIARSSLFIASLPGDCEQIDKEFYVFQEIFYELCMALNGELNEKEDQP